MACSGYLKISLKAIKGNYQLLDELSSPSCKTGVSIKADAYGLGAKMVAPALYEVGARDFFVATLDEGKDLLGVLPKAKIYILNGFLYSDRFLYSRNNFIPILNSLEEIKLYQDFAREVSDKLPAVIHFDTAMNRLGLPAYEAKILCEDMSLLEGINLKYIMSHFSSSDEKDNPINERQYEIFSQISSSFKGVKKSLCNSGGIFLSEEYHMDLTRLGIALYGSNPTGEYRNPMHQVVSLNAPIIQIKNVKAGEKAGYNATYCFDKNSIIAIVSIGYADGLLRSLSNNGALYWQGHKMPICGRVSMDLLICDLSCVPEQYYPKVGDMLEVIGIHQSVDDLAKSSGTIPYEILTSLGKRYSRSYI